MKAKKKRGFTVDQVAMIILTNPALEDDNVDSLVLQKCSFHFVRFLSLYSPGWFGHSQEILELWSSEHYGMSKRFCYSRLVGQHTTPCKSIIARLGYGNGVLDWSTEMECWTGVLDWSTGLEYGNGVLEWSTGLEGIVSNGGYMSLKSGVGGTL
jgi:hypothetical protein